MPHGPRSISWVRMAGQPAGTKKKEKDKKKKTMTCKLLAEDFQDILSLKCNDVEYHPGLEEEREKYKDLKILDLVTDVFLDHWEGFIGAGQEKIRHELKTKGYIMCEVTDGEDKEDVVVPEVPPRQGARGGGGRRRHRPGVTKTAEG